MPLMAANSTRFARLRAIPSRSTSSWPLTVALVLAALAFAALVAYSWRYYALAWDDRFDSALHPRLRSSGSLGHLYGNVGLVLILGNMLYLVRRRLVNVTWLGSMKAWMDWHIFSGIVGPAFVVLHSAFALRTWSAMVSSAALAIVVATGLFGRYLYRLVPRVSDGRQEPAEELAADVDHALIALHGLGTGSARAAELIELHVDAAVARAGALRSGLGAIASAVRTMWQIRTLGPAARAAAIEAGASEDAAIEIGRAAAEIGRLIARVDLVDTFARAAAYWRGLHRNLVIIMLLTASLHVSIAVYLGFGL